MDENLDIHLFLELDVIEHQDAELLDFSYLDGIFGDDLNNPIYTDGTDINFEDIEISEEA